MMMKNKSSTAFVFALFISVLVPSASHAYIPKISSGFDHACALTSQGVVCWGNSLASAVSPAVAAVLPSNVVGLASGSYHTCIIDNGNSNSVKCFGWNVNGAVMAPPVPQTNVIEMALGFGHSCVRTTANAVYCWGLNDKGQASVPSIIQTGGATAIYSGPGSKHTCAKTPTNNLVCWGDNSFGQSTIPPVVNGNVSKVAMGSANTCVLMTSGQTTCFGWNAYGQNNVPAGPKTLLFGGRAHHCSMTKTPNNSLCWGNNSNGQAVIPPTVNQSAISNMALGWAHTCTLLRPAANQYSVYCWGDNTDGACSVPALTF